MKEINYLESLSLKDPVYIDVRSPGEFEIDHIPDAINLYIFDDDERSEIGTIYKQIGRDDAIVKGTEFVGVKLPSIIKKITEYKGRNIVIYCARGGMRSRSIASLLSSIGIDVFKLDMGYKGYRRFILDEIVKVDIKDRLFVLQGYTGSGKTNILNKIENSIDLEGMAGHRSSLFGAIGLKQNSQRMFDSLFVKRIQELKDAEYIVIEGESRKIGNLHIDSLFYKQMKSCPVVLIETDIKMRAEIITNEYTKEMNNEDVIDIVKSLKSKLGNDTVSTLLELFSENRITEFTEILLEKYYDPLYHHTLKNLDFIGKIKYINSKDAAENVIKIIENYI